MPTQARPKESLGRQLDARIERDDCRLYELEKTLRLKVQGVGIMKARLVEAELNANLARLEAFQIIMESMLAETQERNAEMERPAQSDTGAMASLSDTVDALEQELNLMQTL